MVKSKKGSRIKSLKFWVKKPKTILLPQENDEPTAPRITSDTVAEHREQVLSGARRFIYPLQHSRNKVVVISSLIIVAVLVGSLIFSTLLLYRYQGTGTFAYKISQLVPFPIAKVDGSYIPYEDYLFELSYSLFYFQNFEQEGVDINSSEGEQLVREMKLQALEKVKLDTVAKKLADEQGIEITDEQVQRQIEFIRNQGGIGDADGTLEEILKNSYNWGVKDLERTIRLQLTRQSLPRVLDTETIEKATDVQQKLGAGEKFSDLAKKYSDDEKSKDKGGVIGTISRTDTELPPEFIQAAFDLDKGEVSDLVESRFGLHLIRVNKIDGDEREVAHILFEYFYIDQFLRDKLAEYEVVDYIII